MSTEAQNIKALAAHREFIDSLDVYLDLQEFDNEEIQAIILTIHAKIDWLNGTLRGIGV